MVQENYEICTLFTIEGCVRLVKKVGIIPVDSFFYGRSVGHVGNSTAVAKANLARRITNDSVIFNIGIHLRTFGNEVTKFATIETTVSESFLGTTPPRQLVRGEGTKFSWEEKVVRKESRNTPHNLPVVEEDILDKSRWDADIV